MKTYPGGWYGLVAKVKDARASALTLLKQTNSIEQYVQAWEDHLTFCHAWIEETEIEEIENLMDEIWDHLQSVTCTFNRVVGYKKKFACWKMHKADPAGNFQAALEEVLKFFANHLDTSKAATALSEGLTNFNRQERRSLRMYGHPLAYRKIKHISVGYNSDGIIIPESLWFQGRIEAVWFAEMSQYGIPKKPPLLVRGFNNA